MSRAEYFADAVKGQPLAKTFCFSKGNRSILVEFLSKQSTVSS